MADGSASSPMASHESTFTEQMRVVGQSQVIGYASADTNNTTNILFTITEIWKGSQEASTLGVTNGMQFPHRWPADGGTPPEGAVVMFPRVASSSMALAGRGFLFVRAGRVLDMTIQEFKTKAGL